MKTEAVREVEMFEPGKMVWCVSCNAPWKIWDAIYRGVGEQLGEKRLRIEASDGIYLGPKDGVFATRQLAVQYAKTLRDKAIEESKAHIARLQALTWEVE
jgi:hypothetical protein